VIDAQIVVAVSGIVGDPGGVSWVNHRRNNGAYVSGRRNKKAIGEYIYLLLYH
jgi:hypothetical protein